MRKCFVVLCDYGCRRAGMKTPWWDSVGGFVTDDGRWGQGIRR